MSSLPAGLSPRGRLIVVGLGFDPISVSTVDLVFGGRTIAGTLTGSSIDNEDNCLQPGDGSRADDRGDADGSSPGRYERMMSGSRPRLRIVLTAN